VVPLPPWLLDLGLALNLLAAAALLLAALSVRTPLELSVFPTLLLVTTLFRLALNVSSTRLALAEGHAGQIIQAFGEFVVRGDYVVGGVVFAVITLVQFLVVAKGAERVSEVAARFTLDAMPGKQMAIDADLRSGLVDQNGAASRRRGLERESQMFGAMDGAMKFVKGDVVAGLVIVVVNLLGGLAIGVLQRGLEAREALATYALIAIGDGLCSQVPSLCVAVAAGLVVTRVAPGEDGRGLGQDIGDYVKQGYYGLTTIGAPIPARSHTGAFGFVDNEGKRLTGANRYTMTFDVDDLPPVTEFWELPMYDLNGYFVENELDRYSFTSFDLERGDLRMTDGKLVIHIQHDRPADPDQVGNWLPAPAEGFHFAFRFYGPKGNLVDGRYQIPGIVRVD